MTDGVAMDRDAAEDEKHVENDDLEQQYAAGGADDQPLDVCTHTSSLDSSPMGSSVRPQESVSSVSTALPVKYTPTLEALIKGEYDDDAVDGYCHLAELVSFKGCEELCRASSLEVVLGKGGKLFQNSAGCASTYALSEQVKYISVFLSHNWSTPRWIKSLTLMLHFNMLPAIYCTMAVCVFIGWLSYLNIAYLQVYGEFPRGILFRLACAPAFLVFLFLWQELRHGQGCKGLSIFLDKVCIHQVDKSIQIRGIRKLAAFLGCSKQMVVVYTDVYLQRLWTVYEIASFITLHPIEKLVVLPTSISMTVIVGVVLMWFAHSMTIVMEDKTGSEYSVHICTNLATLAFFYRVRSHCREIAAMRARVKNFEVRDCVCACEEDRPVVYQNIAVLMRACAAVSESATDDEALDAFNLLARNVLPCAVKASIGTFALRYKHILLITTVMGIPRGFDLDIGIFFGMPAGVMLRYSCSYMAISWGVIPVMGFLMSTFANNCLHLKGVLNHVYVLTAWLAVGILTFHAVELIHHLEHHTNFIFFLVVLLSIAAPVGIEYWMDAANFKVMKGLLSKNLKERRC